MGLSERGIAEACSINPGQLHKLKMGQMSEVTPEMLGKLLRGLSADDRVKLDVIDAYVADKLLATSIEGATKLYAGSRTSDRAKFAKSSKSLHEHIGELGVTARTASDLMDLGKAAKSNVRLQRILSDLASMVR